MLSVSSLASYPPQNCSGCIHAQTFQSRGEVPVYMLSRLVCAGCQFCLSREESCAVWLYTVQCELDQLARGIVNLHLCSCTLHTPVWCDISLNTIFGYVFYSKISTDFEFCGFHIMLRQMAVLCLCDSSI